MPLLFTLIPNTIFNHPSYVNKNSYNYRQGHADEKPRRTEHQPPQGKQYSRESSPIFHDTLFSHFAMFVVVTVFRIATTLFVTHFHTPKRTIYLFLVVFFPPEEITLYPLVHFRLVRVPLVNVVL